MTPVEHYRLEKAKRGHRGQSPHHDALEAARRQYHALLESDAARQKGGRPRKNAPPSPGKPADAEMPDEDDSA